MRIDRQSKIIIGIFGFIALFFVVGCSHAASVDVGGWTFTADLGDQWRSDPHAAENGDIAGWDSRSTDYLIEHNMDSEDPNFYNWKGVHLYNAFWLPKENAVINPQDIPHPLDHDGNDILATIEIWVHKVPKNVLDWKTHDMLFDLCGSIITGKSSVKDIEFNGRPALLVEEDYDSDEAAVLSLPAYSFGNIAILMTDDTVVQLDVVTKPESGLRAWDVIEKFTISPMN